MTVDGHIHAGYWSPSMFLGRGASFETMDACLVECGIDGAIVSGSGPCVFGIGKDKEEVLRAREVMESKFCSEDRGWRVIIAPTA